MPQPFASPFIKLPLYVLPSFHFCMPKPSFFPNLFLVPINPKSCIPDKDGDCPPLLLSLLCSDNLSKLFRDEVLLVLFITFGLNKL